MLKKHIRSHSDFRPYTCRHCNFSFKTKGNLTKHMKSKAHHKKCVELGITPVPTAVDDDQDGNAQSLEVRTITNVNFDLIFFAYVAVAVVVVAVAVADYAVYTLKNINNLLFFREINLVRLLYQEIRTLKISTTTMMTTMTTISMKMLMRVETSLWELRRLPKCLNQKKRLMLKLLKLIHASGRALLPRGRNRQHVPFQHLYLLLLRRLQHHIPRRLLLPQNLPRLP